MGGLPALTQGRARWRVHFAACCRWLGAVLAVSACDSAETVPQKSRVQAVLAEPGAAATPAPARVTPEAEPRPQKPRPPLCAGQLAGKAEVLRPKRVPEQMSLGPARELPVDPLKTGSGRWTWVNFWAAWCVPCKEELPLLLGWQSRLGSKLDFVFVSFDDDERQLRDFLHNQPERGLRSSYWLPDGAARRAWLDALSLDTEPELPLQLLIDPGGRVRCRVQGAVEAADLAALEDILAG